MSCHSNWQIWLAMRYNTWLSELSASRMFIPRIGAWTDAILCSLNPWLKTGVEFQVYWLSNISPFISYNSYVCWTSGRATRVQHFLSVQASISSSTMHNAQWREPKVSSLGGASSFTFLPPALLLHVSFQLGCFLPHVEHSFILSCAVILWWFWDFSADILEYPCSLQVAKQL